MYVQCVRFRRELPADALYSRVFHLAVTLKLTPVRLTIIFSDINLDISLHIFVAEIRLRFFFSFPIRWGGTRCLPKKRLLRIDRLFCKH